MQDPGEDMSHEYQQLLLTKPVQAALLTQTVRGMLLAS